MKILVLNAGSSSLKYNLFQMPDAVSLAKGKIDRIGKDDSTFSYRHGEKEETLSIAVREHEQGVGLVLEKLADESVGVIKELREIDAIGHRIVHGGAEFSNDLLIDENVVESLDNIINLAPLHNLRSINCIQAVRKILPQTQQIACFDTEFHKTIPPVAYTYGLPYELCEKYNIRRYGFHGLSHQYVSEKASRFLGIEKEKFDAITCHLGNGCSMAAIKNGLSIDTSMGFTPLEGLVMGTRCGDIDPEIIVYLMEKGYDYKHLVRLFNKESGLLGISGISNDMRTIFKMARQGHYQSELAIDVFVYRIKKYIGAYYAVMGKTDALVFTGGIGENAPEIRKLICNGLEHLGIIIDESKNNETIGTEASISDSKSHIELLVIPTNEEMVIADKTYELNKRKEL